MLAPIADQPTARGEVAPTVHRRNWVARCQRQEALVTGVEERVGTDEERVRVL
jgi:hypothetical protein